MLGPWALLWSGLGLCAAGAGIYATLTGGPAVIAPWAAPLIAGGVASLILGGLIAALATLERRLIETERALAETRALLTAEIEAQTAARVEAGSGFRSRPARARKRWRA